MQITDIKPGFYIVSIRNKTFRRNLTDGDLSDRIIYENLANLKLDPMCDVVYITNDRRLCYKKKDMEKEREKTYGPFPYVKVADILKKSQEEIDRENEKIKGDMKLVVKTFKDMVDEFQKQGFSRPEAINIVTSLVLRIQNTSIKTSDRITVCGINQRQNYISTSI